MISTKIMAETDLYDNRKVYLNEQKGEQGMSVLVLNTLSEYNDEVLELQNQICAQSEGSEVVHTKEMKISHCIGCNYCWLKTPGICTIKDDYEIILKKILQHEKIVFITETKFGFVSYGTKNLLDRILPIATMYLQFVDGQMRHVPRYDIRPQMGIIYTGDAEHAYLERWMERTALNFESTSLGVFSLEEGRRILSCI